MGDFVNENKHSLIINKGQKKTSNLNILLKHVKFINLDISWSKMFSKHFFLKKC